MDNKIVFFSRMCLLDNTSGAALSVRSFLEALSASGMDCHSFTASHFDPNREINRIPILGQKAAEPEALWKRFVINRNGVKHSVFLTKHTRSGNTSNEELQRFEASWVNWLKINKPKVVITFGGTSFSVRLQQHARSMGAKIIFYLGNAEYDNSDFYQPGDTVICPSEFLREHYRNTLGLDAHVLRTIMRHERFDQVSQASVGELLYRKKKGFITFMTPIPHKGLTLFARIAKLAFRERPDIKFLVTEGRSSKDWLAKSGYDLTQFPNVWFMSNHEDVRSIYERTSILLVPSFWQEGFSRSILEAQLSGIPVLATNRGGTAEALNGGGTLFDTPENCLADFMARPDDHYVLDWWGKIQQLLDDDEAYISASNLALSASRPFHPDATTANAINFFTGFLTD